MGIYQEFIRGVRHGKSWSVDLKKKTIKLDGKYLIKEGVYEGNLGVWSDGPVQGHLNRLYANYKTSVPAGNGRKERFIAIPEEKLSLTHRIESESREIAAARLNGYLVCQILNGYEWPFGKEYFHVMEDKNFILLKLYWSK